MENEVNDVMSVTKMQRVIIQTHETAESILRKTYCRISPSKTSKVIAFEVTVNLDLFIEKILLS